MQGHDKQAIAAMVILVTGVLLLASGVDYRLGLLIMLLGAASQLFLILQRVRLQNDG